MPTPQEAFPEQGQEKEKDNFDPPGLEAFSKWSNYLLVTTVAAVGWISSGHIKFRNNFLQSLSIWCLGVSVIFGIFTSALVPLISEQAQKNDTSIYSVKAIFSIFRIPCHTYLTQACRPQHVLFIAGIIVYCWGVTSIPWQAFAVGAVALIYGFSHAARILRQQTVMTATLTTTATANVDRLYVSAGSSRGRLRVTPYWRENCGWCRHRRRCYLVRLMPQLSPTARRYGARPPTSRA